MPVFPTRTGKISHLDGQINAAQRSIALLETMMGGDHDDILADQIFALEALNDSRMESRAFYAAKTGTNGFMTVDILLHNYAHGFAEQAIVFDGIPVMCRERDKTQAAIRMNTMLVRPDDVLPMDTLIGPAAVTLAQCQGLLHAGAVLADAIRTATTETTDQNAADPFTDWESIMDYFNQSFEANYVPFIFA